MAMDTEPMKFRLKQVVVERKKDQPTNWAGMDTGPMKQKEIAHGPRREATCFACSAGPGNLIHDKQYHVLNRRTKRP